MIPNMWNSPNKPWFLGGVEFQGIYREWDYKDFKHRKVGLILPHDDPLVACGGRSSCHQIWPRDAMGHFPLLRKTPNFVSDFLKDMTLWEIKGKST